MQQEPYPALDDGFGHWLAGFIDGEGSFQITRINRAGGYFNYQCRFALTLRADDGAVLEEIHARTGIGTLRLNPARRKQPHWNPARTWHITGKRDCFALVELLERYPLRAKKAREFAVWAEAVRFWMTNYERRNGQHHGRADWTPMEAFTARLTATREYATEAHAAVLSADACSSKPVRANMTLWK